MNGRMLRPCWCYHQQVPECCSLVSPPVYNYSHEGSIGGINAPSLLFLERYKQAKPVCKFRSETKVYQIQKSVNRMFTKNHYTKALNKGNIAA